MAVLLVIWIVCGFVGWKIGESKGRARLGLVLGFLLGLIGLVIIALVKPVGRATAPAANALGTPLAPPSVPSPAADEARVPCPHCDTAILPAAHVCPECRSDVQPSALLPLPAGSAAQWLRDPSGRFADRFWNGAAWTEWVRDDPMDGPQTDAPVPARAVGAES